MCSINYCENSINLRFDLMTGFRQGFLSKVRKIPEQTREADQQIVRKPWSKLAKTTEHEDKTWSVFRYL